LLTTTHELPKGMSNHDIATGDFRLMDLFQPPYGFPADVQARIEDYLPPDPRRFMCLWSREQVSDAVESLAAYFADAGSPSPGNPGAVDPQVYRLAVKEASGEGMTRETPRQRARREAA